MHMTSLVWPSPQTSLTTGPRFVLGLGLGLELGLGLGLGLGLEEGAQNQVPLIWLKF